MKEHKNSREYKKFPVMHLNWYIKKISTKLLCNFATFDLLVRPGSKCMIKMPSARILNHML
jgi:hypothetical protein